MSERGIDVQHLTENQQNTLQQFVSVTDQDLAAAIPLLTRCEWNVQIAIARFFDGEPATEPPSAPLPDRSPPPTDSRRQEVLLNGFTNISQATSRSRLEPAPRIVTASGPLFNRRPPYLVSILCTPLNLIYAFLSRIATLLARTFPFLPRLLGRLLSSSAYHVPSPPQESRDRFLRYFRGQYDPDQRLPLASLTYARTFDKAKKDLHFLLVLLLSPEHDATPAFVHNVVLSTQVVDFLRDSTTNIITWAGSVADPETYQVATALNVTKFPFAALIAHTPSISSTAMSVVARLEEESDIRSPEAFLARIDAAVRQYGEGLQQARAHQSERQANQDLREQQNSAYERSLATDRARLQAKREAERAEQDAKEAQQHQAREQETRERKAHQWRRWRASKLRPEPKTMNDGTRVSIRLLDGTRIIRTFFKDSKMEELYAFVECHSELSDVGSAQGEAHEAGEPRDFSYTYGFRLVSPMPREVYSAQERTIGECLGRSGNLVVERAEDYE